jgi:hypothetical protein
MSFGPSERRMAVNRSDPGRDGIRYSGAGTFASGDAVVSPIPLWTTSTLQSPCNRMQGNWAFAWPASARRAYTTGSIARCSRRRNSWASIAAALWFPSTNNSLPPSPIRSHDYARQMGSRDQVGVYSHRVVGRHCSHCDPGVPPAARRGSRPGYGG